MSGRIERSAERAARSDLWRAFGPGLYLGTCRPGRSDSGGDLVVDDDDLGRSAGGGVSRVGFERMVAEVCLGKVGAVAALEVSRFARNSRDWQQLIEMCRVVDTVLVDQESPSMWRRSRAIRIASPAVIWQPRLLRMARGSRDDRGRHSVDPSIEDGSRLQTGFAMNL